MHASISVVIYVMKEMLNMIRMHSILMIEDLGALILENPHTFQILTYR